MRFQVGQTVLAASAALALAACTSTGGPATPAYPISTPTPQPEAEPAPPPPSAPPADNAITAALSQSVTSQPLAPPPRAASPYTPPPASIPEEPPLRPAQTYAPPPPPPAPVTVLSVTGKVVEVEGKPQVHVVKRGDTIYAISHDFDMTPKELAEANKLKAPYKIKPGEKLTGPRGKAKAYVVGSGDTFYSIAKRFNVKPAVLASENDKKVGASIRSGEKVLLPKGYKDGGPLRRTTTPAAPAYRPPAYTPPVPAYSAPYSAPPVSTPAPAYVPPAQTYSAPATQPARPYTPLPAPMAAPPRNPAAPAIIDSSAAPSDQDVIAAGRGKFVWPLQGDLINGFGPKGPGGQRSDGLNIRAAAGAPVSAAAAGEVVYAGDQVPEFGNLVLIKHADGWVTAYAHLARSDVKMRQTVTQGQTIGTAGMSGGVSEPQVHFEVRYAPTPKDKARPIDPALVLPK